MIPVLTAANVTAYVTRPTTTDGWGGDTTWGTVETVTGRIHALSGTERIQAQAIDRDSTHRLYVDTTAATEADRVIITDGRYGGEYLIRFVDYRSAPGMSFYQIDLQYAGAIQGPSGGS